MDYKCSICLDEKHIPDPSNPNGPWIRCSCLLGELLQLNLARAGITYPPESLNFDSISKNYAINVKSLEFAKGVASRLREGGRPKAILCFQGSYVGPMDVFVQTILYEALLGGTRVRQVTMEQLIANHFAEDGDSLEEEFQRASVLSVNFGNELQYNVAGNYLNSLVRMFWSSPKNYLILNTNLTLGDIFLKYGSDVANLFVSADSIVPHDRRVVVCHVEA